MRQLILLYWGCVFLMYLSQVYYPTSMQLEGPQTGRRHFMLRKADIFMIIVIVWLTCFSFLRTSYNETGNYIFFWRTAETTSDFNGWRLTRYNRKSTIYVLAVFFP